MPIDFLEGKVKKPKVEKSRAPEVEMHIPQKELKEKIAAPKVEEKPKVKKEILPAEEMEEVNLMTSFWAHLWRKRLTFSGIFVIIILLLAGLYYYFIPRISQVPQPIENINKINQNTNLIVNLANENLNIANGNVNENLNFNENLNIPVIVPPPVPPENPPVIVSPILPDTELAPLRGSLVKFSGSSEIYLIENNGELRPVDKQTVIFKDGESIYSISSSLLYTLNDRFKEVRQGRAVKGRVDWDPRVLSSVELQPFQ